MKLTLAGVLALCVLGTGCAAVRIQLEELPSEPIALIYRTPQQARERAEQLEAPEDKPQSRPGVVRLDQVEEFVDSLRGNKGSAPRTEGRMALLDPQTGEVDILESGRRGDVPVAWTPDHRGLMFLSTRRGAPHLYEIDVKATEVRALTRGHQGHLWGAYGPEDRLAMIRLGKRRGGARAYITGPAGVDPKPLTPGPADLMITWSPASSVVVYAHPARSGVASISAIPADGGQRRLLARGKDPTFSRDGQWIVYSRKRNDRWELWRMRPDGTGKTALGNHGTTDETQPAVSPDGRYVAYVSEENHRQSVRVRRWDGSGDRVLLEDGDGARPVW